MENDCNKFFQKCHKCQIHGDLIKVPPTELNTMSSPWPFTAWGMDVIGPIKLAASNKHRFILVAIDYFPKSVEAASYASVTKKVVADFVSESLTKIRPHTGHKLMNGAVEAANKNIKRILRKMIDNYKSGMNNCHMHYWDILLLPGLLVYGTEALIPAKVEIPSLRIIQEAEPDNAEWIRKRCEQLALIDEKRMITVLSGGAVVLAEKDGQEWLKAINSDAIKRYYM
ncbi:uncharacterized protein LOC132613096 [Lycium barbarum]|uniref:uncharacterized protein LOC132613096 n=1 Tax=Lycium barbarum TaxID=112863 RepID=UPI00293EE17B|nr:uncharacterized protein LOC132613096 [Lycium barbarum]